MIRCTFKKHQSTALLRNSCRGVKAKTVRLVRKLHQQFRSEMMGIWVRAVMMEEVRSGWILDIFLKQSQQGLLMD